MGFCRFVFSTSGVYRSDIQNIPDVAVRFSKADIVYSQWVECELHFLPFCCVHDYGFECKLYCISSETVTEVATHNLS